MEIPAAVDNTREAHAAPRLCWWRQSRHNQNGRREGRSAPAAVPAALENRFDVPRIHAQRRKRQPGPRCTSTIPRGRDAGDGATQACPLPACAVLGIHACAPLFRLASMLAFLSSSKSLLSAAASKRRPIDSRTQAATSPDRTLLRSASLQRIRPAHSRRRGPFIFSEIVGSRIPSDGRRSRFCSVYPRKALDESRRFPRGSAEVPRLFPSC